ncbi:MAG: phosphatidylinositol mannoside acyltransferase [Nitriliruptoraceae bacterium]
MTRPVAVIDLPPPPPFTPRSRLAYLRYLALWESVARLPDRLARVAPRIAGDAWWRLASASRRAQVRANLRRIVPEASTEDLEDLVREAHRSYARYWVDSFRLHRMDPAQVVASSTLEGVEHADAARDSRRGGVLVTGHLGSWDVGAMFAAQRDWSMVVVAEVVEPRALFDRFVALRRGIGVEVVPLVRGAQVMRVLERHVADGALVTLLTDRDLTRRGPIVEFFGEPCRLPAGPSVLARSAGCPVMASAFLTSGDGFHGVVRPPLDLTELSIIDGMQVVANELEVLIRRDPTQWHVFVANWLVEREPHHPVIDAWRRGEDWRALARAERRAYTQGARQ